MFLRIVKFIGGFILASIEFIFPIGQWTFIAFIIGTYFMFDAVRTKEEKELDPLFNNKKTEVPTKENIIIEETNTSSKKDKKKFPTLKGYIGITLAISMLIMLTIQYKPFGDDYDILFALLAFVFMMVGIVLTHNDWLEYIKDKPRTPQADFHKRHW